LKNSGLIISSGLDSEDAEDREDAGPDIELRQLVFGAAQHGLRLDRALAELVPEFSRSYLQQLIDLGGVSINGAAVCKPSTRIKAADRGVVELRPTPQSQAFKPESMTLELVYEDEHLMVINKPAGLVVHPAPGNWSGTLLNGLLAHDVQAMNLPRAGIVHRLDKDTSGLMVVARTRPVMDALIRAIAAREVSRQYVALAHRPWVATLAREVNAPIGRDPRNRLRMAVVDMARNPGKLARTDIELLQNCHQGCLVQCTLHTGRTHQIRVHMASIGHPLVADELYGGAAAAGLQRQALHACRLAFIHPVTHQSMVFQALPPEDFSFALRQWGLSYNQGRWWR
jgi:23S rRNA pseudouridine1911/1915/1917 synthase